MGPGANESPHHHFGDDDDDDDDDVSDNQEQSRSDIDQDGDDNAHTVDDGAHDMMPADDKSME